mmetsp:Transcript_41348/g.79217  ORF Transcript_41348/g.79217 Transcript_41348/m.79217 type:complete len:310 (-) Transcript_41348:212-1141(-)
MQGMDTLMMNAAEPGAMGMMASGLLPGADAAISGDIGAYMWSQQQAHSEAAAAAAAAAAALSGRPAAVPQQPAPPPPPPPPPVPPVSPVPPSAADNAATAQAVGTSSGTRPPLAMELPHSLLLAAARQTPASSSSSRKAAEANSDEGKSTTNAVGTTDDGPTSRPERRVEKTATDIDPVLDSDSFTTDDDGPMHGRRAYRHKRRAGRVVRERRGFRQKRNSVMVALSSHDRRLGQYEGRPIARRIDSLRMSIKVAVDRGLAELSQCTFVLNAMRFGLFCAMAWSITSIIFSMVRLYMGRSLQNFGGSEG